MTTGKRPHQHRYKNRLWLEVRKLILVRDNYQCQVRGPLCKGRADGVDHKLPVSKGGSDNAQNLRACCKSCNSSKKDQLDSPVVTVNW